MISAPPESPGAYRWYYLDLHAEEHSAVCIFMLGSLFSPRYFAGIPSGALPLQHCAVNLAIYRRGRRLAWILSEYPRAEVSPQGIGIGNSQLCWEGQRAVWHVNERSPLWGHQLSARIELDRESPCGPEVELASLGDHRWQPLLPRGRATLAVPEWGLKLEGTGYLDSNWGRRPLAETLREWRWQRSFSSAQTLVHYSLPHRSEQLSVRATATEVDVAWEQRAPLATRWTPYLLRYPQQLWCGEVQRPATLLESSPFYARFQAEGGGTSVMGEVAHFSRFRSPWVQWMAHFRTRMEPGGSQPRERL